MTPDAPTLIFFIVQYIAVLSGQQLSVTQPIPRDQCIEYARNNPNAACHSMWIRHPGPYLPLPPKGILR